MEKRMPRKLSHVDQQCALDRARTCYEEMSARKFIRKGRNHENWDRSVIVSIIQIAIEEMVAQAKGLER